MSEAIRAFSDSAEAFSDSAEAFSDSAEAFSDSAEAFSDSAGRAGRRVADLVVALQVDPASVARLEEGPEAIRDRAIAFDHARICAGLIWPYRRPLATHWRLSAREAE